MALRTWSVLAGGAVVAATAMFAIAGPAGAAAPGEWVGTAPAVAGGKTCGSPGFNSIQAAVNAAGATATIHVCAGTYVEQVQITKTLTLAGLGNPIIQLPATPANSTTPCDLLIPNSFQPNQDGLSICGPITVHLDGMIINAAWPANTCYDSLYGIFVGGGATLSAGKSSVVAAGAVPLNGCQGGVGIQVGTTRTSPAEVGHLSASHVGVTGYQKNGIDIVGAGSTANINASTIVGAGPTTAIAQNGVEIADGAKVSLGGNTISGNECNNAVCGPSSLLDTQSGGVLLLGAAKGTIVNNNSITSNDIGVYYLADPTGPAPTSATVTIKANQITNDRYEGVCLDQGIAMLSGNSYSGGNVALQGLQYAGQTFGGFSKAGHEAMSGQSVAAVQVLSDNDVTDVPGSLTVSDSHFHGGAVLDNSTNYPIVQHNNVH